MWHPQSLYSGVSAMSRPSWQLPKALLEERRLIERAKALLMRDRKMTEPEAYRWLQKKAMNENRKLAQVVAEFVKKEEADARRAGS